MQVKLRELFDAWIREPSSIQEELAQPQELFFRNELQMSDPQAVIFPPTFARKDKDSKGHPYDINKEPDGVTLRCTLDTVGSQSNRLAQLFEKPAFQGLLPNVVLDAGDKGGLIPMCRVTHRAADGAITASDGAEEFHQGFQAVLAGNALPLAKLDPCSFIFGVWDSRKTLVRFARTIDSTINAYHISYGHRSAQFTPTVDYAGTDLQTELANGKEELDEKHPLAQIGVLGAPSVDKHGGIRVAEKILHLVHVNFNNIRLLNVPEDVQKTLALRRYILGLSILVVLAYNDYNLRSGCHLFRKAAQKPLLFPGEGEPTPVALDVDEVLEYARQAAREFGVTSKLKKFTFNDELVRKLVKEKQETSAKKKADKKKS
jgi:CRISPR-associated protein Csb1